MENQSPLGASMEAYERLKREQETAAGRIENYSDTVTYYKIESAQLLLELKHCNDDGRKNEIQQRLTELKREIGDIQREILRLKQIPFAMNTIIEEMTQNPEIQEAVDKHVERAYRRKQKEAQEKLQKTITFANLLHEHPGLQPYVKGMLAATLKVKEATEEIKKCDPVADADTIEAHRQAIASYLAQFDTNKNNLMQYITNNNINLSENDIVEMTDKGYKLDGNGNIDIEKTLQRQINGYNKQIQHYDIAIANLRPQQQQVQQQTQPAQGSNSAQPQQVPQTQHAVNPIPAYSRNGENLPTDNIHWWNFIKRFRRWRAERRAVRDGTAFEAIRGPVVDVPEGNADNGQPQAGQPEHGQNTPTVDIKENPFQYDVIREMSEQRATEGLKQAKQQRIENQATQPTQQNQPIQPNQQRNDFIESLQLDDPDFGLDEPDFGDESAPAVVEPSTSSIEPDTSSARADDTGSHDVEVPLPSSIDSNEPLRHIEIAPVEAPQDPKDGAKGNLNRDDDGDR